MKYQPGKKNSKVYIDVDPKERQNRRLLCVDYYGEYYYFLSKSTDICKSLISN